MPAYKYQLKDGRTKWYANFYYTDWTGTQQHKCKRGFDTKRAAKEYEVAFLDRYSKNPTILFSSLVSNYMDDMGHRLKPTTLSGKQNIIENKLIPYFGKLQICNIDAEMIRRWQNELISYRNEKGQPYAETYLYTINAQLSAIMNYAVSYYKLPSNPCRIAGFIGKNKADEMNFWTQEEFEHALEHEKKITYQVAFKILFYSGIREGELLALTPQDILRDEAAIDINKNYAVVDGVEFFLTPKTKRSIRIVTIPETLHKQILDFVDSMALDPEERIFYFKKDGLLSEFRRMTKRAGNNPIRIHDLRHSHVAMLVNMGVIIEEISRRLGHDSVKTTWDTYSHLYPGTDKVLAQKIELLLQQEQKAPIVAQYDTDNVEMVPGSPLGKVSQALLHKVETEDNTHIHKNNRNIFQRYGIDIDTEELFGYKLLDYLALLAFGDSIIQIISCFRPDPQLKDFILTLLSDSISSCEMINGSILDLDKFIVDRMIPRYQKIYGLHA